MPENYGAAALRHYADAKLLASNERYDNAGHLIGFAAECSIKHVFQPSGSGRYKHLPQLLNAFPRLVQGRDPRKKAMYAISPLLRTAFNDWDVSLRYQDDGIDKNTYEKWEQMARRALGAAELSQRRR